MKKAFTLILFFLLFLAGAQQGAIAQTCNWKSRTPTATFRDTCGPSSTTIQSAIYFVASKACFKYQWKVNGTIVGGNTNTYNHNVIANGSYNVCVKVTDTCNNCDTTFCSNRVISCIAANCNWGVKNTHAYFSDSCHNSPRTIDGFVTHNGIQACHTYEWKVNGVTVGGNSKSLKYNVTQNGTYNMCVKISDTCSNCDTTLCDSITVSCINACNWSSRSPSFMTYDTCDFGTAVGGMISFGSSTSCFKYQWKVNGATVGGNSNSLFYNTSQNGNYNVCVKVIDTCTGCDTTFCATKVINCFTTICHWKSRNPSASFWDTCSGPKASVAGYLYFPGSSSCYKYQWKVNGNIVGGNSNYLNYNITQNGNYTVCVKVTDTCNMCDTTFCSTRSISCLTSPCNWMSRNPSTFFYDTCDFGSGVGGAISFGSSHCYKYQWKVNGAIVGTNSSALHYSTTTNGTYTVCVKVTDTCSNCDTTFCSTQYINCFTGCNWKSTNPTPFFVDSCGTNSKAIHGSISFGVNNSCFKYQWKVNGAIVGGNSSQLKYTVTQNGTYVVCVKVTDTCNNCDTTFCSTRNITCFPAGCNWKAKNATVYFFDSCDNVANSSLNAFFSSSSGGSCFSYQWKVNGVTVGSNFPLLQHYITQNGTYSVCLKITDFCNNCDTTICSNRVISCLPDSNCNWQSRNPSPSFSDSCSASGSFLYGDINFNSNTSCFVYQWKVNGVPVGSNSSHISYPVTRNGTYNLCVTVLDTCNNCDTTFCSSTIISCMSGVICNWKALNPFLMTYDSCNSSFTTVNGYIGLNSTSGCFNYEWKLNGNVVGGNFNTFSDVVTQNGTYLLCVKVTDSCNNCDTVICDTVVVSCIPPTGIRGNDPSAPIEVYPNPSSGIIQLQGLQQPGVYRLMDMTGRLMQSGKLLNENEQLDLNAYPEGMYLLHIESGGAIQTTKILLQRQ